VLIRSAKTYVFMLFRYLTFSQKAAVIKLLFYCSLNLIFVDSFDFMFIKPGEVGVQKNRLGFIKALLKYDYFVIISFIISLLLLLFFLLILPGTAIAVESWSQVGPNGFGDTNYVIF